MDKSSALKTIAETAYNVGYGAKVNFATLDIVDKIPGLLNFIGLLVGVYALIVRDLTADPIGAAMVMLGIIGLYISMYQSDRDAYDKAGRDLTAIFYELKKLYFEAKSRPDTDNFDDIMATHGNLLATSISSTSSKQILFSDWYAHYKFFWQQQIEWIDEQKNFSLLRDKLPLTFTIIILGLLLYTLVLFFAGKLPFSCGLI
jgi:hypothetical protein